MPDHVSVGQTERTLWNERCWHTSLNNSFHRVCGLVTGLSKVCGNWGKGGLKLCAGPDAEKAAGTRILTLLIQDA